MLRVDDEFFEPETGRLIKVMAVSPHGEFKELDKKFVEDIGKIVDSKVATVLYNKD